MITNTVALEELVNSSRWNADFFIDIKRKITQSNNYEIKKVGDLVTERKEFLLPGDYGNHCFNYIGLENLSQNTRSLSNFEPRSGSTIKSRCKVFRQGDILYGRLRPTLNKALLVTDEIAEGICSTEIFVLIPNTDLVAANYLVETLISKIVLDRVGGITAGAALPRIQIKDFLNLDIPLPSLTQQKTIASHASIARKEAQRLLNEANNIFTQLPNAFVASIESGSATISLPPANESEKKFINPLPKGEFRVRRRGKL